jgi:hypothetical protein
VALTGSAAFAIAADDVETLAATPVTPTPATGPRSGPEPGSNPAPPTMAISRAAPIAHTSLVGTKGERVHVDVVSTTLPNQCGTITVRGPDDNVLAGGCTTVGTAVDGLLLPDDGVYNIYVDPTGGAVGQIALRVVTSFDQVQAASIGGDPVVATIPVSGAQSRITFAGTSGQSVFVDATEGTIPDQCGALELDAPDHSDVALGCLTGGSGYIDRHVLASSGTYTVLVNPTGDGTGSVVIRIVEDRDQVTATTVDGLPVVATIAEPGATARVTFPGAAHQHVQVTLSSSTLPNQCVPVSVLGPDQSTLTSACVVISSATIPTVTLPVAGTYTVVVDPYGAATGALDVAVTSAP